MTQLPDDNDLAGPNEIAPTLVIIPTYNEIGNVEHAISGVLNVAAHLHILVVDDNSPDGTGARMESLAIADKRVHVLHRPAKLGLGAAYINGFMWAKAQGYRSVVQMDADGSHRPEDLPKLLDALKSYHAVTGSRWTSGGKVVNWPKRRELLSRVGNLYTRLWLGMPVADATGGFRAFRMTTLDAIKFTEIKSQGYCFQVDLTWRCSQAGFAIKEIPITFVERTIGDSKMSVTIVREAIMQVTRWGLLKRKQDLVRMFRSN